MREKAKELQRERLENAKKGVSSSSISHMSGGSISEFDILKLFALR